MKKDYVSLGGQAQHDALMQYPASILKALANKVGVELHNQRKQQIAYQLIQSGKLEIRFDIHIGIKDKDLKGASKLKPPVIPQFKHPTLEESRRERLAEQDWRESVEVEPDSVPVDLDYLLEFCSFDKNELPTD